MKEAEEIGKMIETIIISCSINQAEFANSTKAIKQVKELYCQLSKAISKINLIDDSIIADIQYMIDDYIENNSSKDIWYEKFIPSNSFIDEILEDY